MSRSSQRNALLIHRYYSQFGTTQLKEMVKNRLKRARLGPKCPFWWPWRSLEGTEDQIWSLLSLAAPPVLDSLLSHTLDKYWASSVWYGMLFDFIVWFYAEFYFILLHCNVLHDISLYCITWHCIVLYLI